MINNIPVDKTSDVEALKNTMGYTAGKNYFNYTPTSTPYTSSGITYTVNEDKSITMNGTATADSVFYLYKDKEIPNGDYILTGLTEYSEDYYLKLLSSTYATMGTDNGNGMSFTVTDDVKPNIIGVHVPSGKTVNNVTVYPMIRKASVKDDTYEPYCADRLDVDTRLNNIASILGWKTASATGGTLIELDGVYGEIEIKIRVKYGSTSYYGNLTTEFRNIHLSDTPATKTLSGGITLSSGSSTTCTVTYTISKTMFQVTQIVFGSQTYDISNVTSISITYR